MKCGYKQCKFNGEVEKENAIKHGSRYYHKECFTEKQNKDEIRKIYLQHINPAEVVKTLNMAINGIIHKKNIESDYLLFVVKYVIKHKLTINNPLGLHYHINNFKIKQSWQSLKVKAQQEYINLDNIVTEEVKFEYKPPNKSSWDIIKR